MGVKAWTCASSINYNIFLLPAFPNPVPRASLNPRRHEAQREPPLLSCLGKRKLGLSSLSLILSGFFPNLPMAMSAQELELERYIDSKEGFTLLRPSSWIKVEKAGATILFEEADKGSTNNVGVLVNPIRLNALTEFGSPEFVVDKLIHAERRKESTKEAEVIAVAQRLGQGGSQVYEFEYKVDSTRGGMKRVFSAAFVASKKLYLLNISHSDKPENPLDTHTRTVLEQVLHSFDSAPLV
ncbi:psbP domain-containing protein 2, chloroplastic [Humulus lupulus]|uniref:psbP domain-containing protein 2, chloroplastic n=1 Tax=Humulus lupulus TaxID=3486 RepID=UPI002B40AF08|nr:psbP domain-containing protein 2, chloroplastic [Humulus lupulus]